METYTVTLTGTSPLLMHADDPKWRDRMIAWKAKPSSKKEGVAGDDRTPAWRWVGCLYRSGGRVVMPSDNLATCIREGGALVPVPGGRSGKTFKSQSQSGIWVRDASWPILVHGDEVPAPELDEDLVYETKTYEEWEAYAVECGYELLCKPVRIGMAKHLRVRPLFAAWQVTGTVVVVDQQITKQVLTDILGLAGQLKGLGDWRPSSRTPGRCGMFEATVE